MSLFQYMRGSLREYIMNERLGHPTLPEPETNFIDRVEQVTASLYCAVMDHSGDIAVEPIPELKELCKALSGYSEALSRRRKEAGS